jgi:hypothetical protein
MAPQSVILEAGRAALPVILYHTTRDGRLGTKRNGTVTKINLAGRHSQIIFSERKLMTSINTMLFPYLREDPGPGDWKKEVIRSMNKLAADVQLGQATKYAVEQLNAAVDGFLKSLGIDESD